MSNWKDAGAGVMLWKPTVEVRIDNTGRTFSSLSIGTGSMEERQDGSSRAASPNTVLPSIEENLRTKQLIYDELFSTPDVTVPPAGYSQVSPRTVAASPPSIKDQVVDHLKYFTSPSLSVLSEPGPAHLGSTPTGNTSSTASTETSYDSDHTNFLEHPETPCPTRVSYTNSKKKTKRATGRTSHHFRKSAASNREVSVRRQLNFGVPKAPNASLVFKTPIKMVRAPEYGPNHAWAAEQDQLLCVLWRWYHRQRKDYVAIFNAYFGLDLKFRNVDNRFFNYLRLHGAKAFRTYKAVFVSVPFDDPHGVFDEVRTKIDKTAASLGIKLGRLPEELHLSHGQARLAKSPKTRKLYKSLVRKAAAEERLEAVERTQKKTDVVAPPTFGRVAIHTEAEFDSSEYFTDDEETACGSFASDDPSEEFSFKNIERPALAFRVFDASSKTQFTRNGSIVSEGLQLWNGTMPPAPHSGGVMDVLLANHLSMSRGGTSFYISVSVSLLQVFNKASNMSRPSIAIIALDHQSLSAPGKVLYAKDVLLRLKRLGQAKWARRYRGWAEWLMFGQIPSECIIHCLPLADLIRLSDIYSDVRSLLHLSEFKPELRTLAVSKELANHRTTLNASSGTAMARFALLFGLGMTDNLQHLSAFCARVVDGWSVKEATAQETNAAAHAFANTMNSQFHSKQAVMKAFMQGVEDGLKTLDYFARRRRTA